MELQVINIAALFGNDSSAKVRVAHKLAAAAEEIGFFYVCGHAVSPDIVHALEAEAKSFFAAPAAEKSKIAMAKAGSAWRGWFPLGGELTSGEPDAKEGLYFGEDHPGSDPRVQSGWPLHGSNLWPDGRSALREAVERYMAAAETTASALISGLSVALGLPANGFANRYLARPTQLFRIFRYPPTESRSWGVGEHTDYGLLTITARDDAGGLEIRTPSGWQEAVPMAGTLV